MHGSQNVKYAVVGFFTKSNKEWSSSMCVLLHKMEMTNVLCSPKNLASYFSLLFINYIKVCFFLLTYF